MRKFLFNTIALLVLEIFLFNSISVFANIKDKSIIIKNSYKYLNQYLAPGTDILNISFNQEERSEEDIINNKLVTATEELLFIDKKIILNRKNFKKINKYILCIEKILILYKKKYKRDLIEIKNKKNKNFKKKTIIKNISYIALGKPAKIKIREFFLEQEFINYNESKDRYVISKKNSFKFIQYLSKKIKENEDNRLSNLIIQKSNNIKLNNLIKSFESFIFEKTEQKVEENQLDKEVVNKKIIEFIEQLKKIKNDKQQKDNIDKINFLEKTVKTIKLFRTFMSKIKKDKKIFKPYEKIFFENVIKLIKNINDFSVAKIKEKYRELLNLYYKRAIIKKDRINIILDFKKSKFENFIEYFEVNERRDIFQELKRQLFLKFNAEEKKNIGSDLDLTRISGGTGVFTGANLLKFKVQEYKWLRQNNSEKYKDYIKNVPSVLKESFGKQKKCIDSLFVYEKRIRYIKKMFKNINGSIAEKDKYDLKKYSKKINELFQELLLDIESFEETKLEINKYLSEQSSKIIKYYNEYNRSLNYFQKHSDELQNIINYSNEEYNSNTDGVNSKIDSNNKDKYDDTDAYEEEDRFAKTIVKLDMHKQINIEEKEYSIEELYEIYNENGSIVQEYLDLISEFKNDILLILANIENLNKEENVQKLKKNLEAVCIYKNSKEKKESFENINKIIDLILKFEEQQKKEYENYDLLYKINSIYKYIGKDLLNPSQGIDYKLAKSQIKEYLVEVGKDWSFLKDVEFKSIITKFLLVVEYYFKANNYKDEMIKKYWIQFKIKMPENKDIVNYEEIMKYIKKIKENINLIDKVQKNLLNNIDCLNDKTKKKLSLKINKYKLDLKNLTKKNSQNVKHIIELISRIWDSLNKVVRKNKQKNKLYINDKSLKRVKELKTDLFLTDINLFLQWVHENEESKIEIKDVLEHQGFVNILTLFENIYNEQVFEEYNADEIKKNLEELSRGKADTISEWLNENKYISKVQKENDKYIYEYFFTKENIANFIGHVLNKIKEKQDNNFAKNIEKELICFECNCLINELKKIGKKKVKDNQFYSNLNEIINIIEIKKGKKQRLDEAQKIVQIIKPLNSFLKKIKKLIFKKLKNDPAISQEYQLIFCNFLKGIISSINNNNLIQLKNIMKNTAKSYHILNLTEKIKANGLKKNEFKRYYRVFKIMEKDNFFSSIAKEEIKKYDTQKNTLVTSLKKVSTFLEKELDLLKENKEIKLAVSFYRYCLIKNKKIEDADKIFKQRLSGLKLNFNDLCEKTNLNQQIEYMKKIKKLRKKISLLLKFEKKLKILDVKEKTQLKKFKEILVLNKKIDEQTAIFKTNVLIDSDIKKIDEIENYILNSKVKLKIKQRIAGVNKEYNEFRNCLKKNQDALQFIQDKINEIRTLDKTYFDVDNEDKITFHVQDNNELVVTNEELLILDYRELGKLSSVNQLWRFIDNGNIVYNRIINVLETIKTNIESSKKIAVNSTGLNKIIENIKKINLNIEYEEDETFIFDEEDAVKEEAKPSFFDSKNFIAMRLMLGNISKFKKEYLKLFETKTNEQKYVDNIDSAGYEKKQDDEKEEKEEDKEEDKDFPVLNPANKEVVTFQKGIGKEDLKQAQTDSEEKQLEEKIEINKQDKKMNKIKDVNTDKVNNNLNLWFELSTVLILSIFICASISIGLAFVPVLSGWNVLIGLGTFGIIFMSYIFVRMLLPKISKKSETVKIYEKAVSEFENEKNKTANGKEKISFILDMIKDKKINKKINNVFNYMVKKKDFGFLKNIIDKNKIYNKEKLINLLNKFQDKLDNNKNGNNMIIDLEDNIEVISPKEKILEFIAVLEYAA